MISLYRVYKGKSWNHKMRFLVFGLLIIASLFRIYLFLNTPLSYRTGEVYDDYAMFSTAKYIASFQWLGPYNEMTLIKEISYPLLGALCSLASIPYSFVLGILCISSAALLILAIDKVITNVYFLAILYLLIIYSPVGFFAHITQRTYQMAIVPYAVLCVISCMIALFLRRNEEKWGGWPIGAAVSLAFFWNIRSDSIWILPFIIAATLISLGFIIRDEKKITKRIFWRKLFPVFFPLVFLLIVNLGISSINYFCYGVFVRNDRTSSNFSKMMECLYKIEDEEESLDVWCSNRAIEKAMQASPTLLSIKDEIEASEYSWTGGSFDDMKGDMTVWMMRTALNNAGLFADAKQMDSFCEKVVNELDVAFEKGLLKNDEKIHLGGVQIQEEYIRNGKYLEDFLEYFVGILNWKGSIAQIHGVSVSTGDITKIREWELFYNSFTIYPDYPDTSTGEVMHDPAAKDNYYIQQCVNGICALFQNNSGIVNILSIIALIACTICLFINRNCFEIWIIVIGLLLTAMLNIMAVTLFTSWFDDNMETYIYMYLAGAYPLIQVVKYISLYLGYISLRERVKSKK